MKTVIFDMNAIGRENENGGISYRQHFDTILKYLSLNKVHVYLRGNWRGMPAGLMGYVTGVFRMDEDPPRMPDLVITSDENFAKMFSSIVIPPYAADFNEFAALSLAGNLLDVLKDRVVLGKQAEPEKIVKPEEQNDKESDDDPTNYSFSI